MSHHEFVTYINEAKPGMYEGWLHKFESSIPPSLISQLLLDNIKPPLVNNALFFSICRIPVGINVNVT